MNKKKGSSNAIVVIAIGATILIFLIVIASANHKSYEQTTSYGLDSAYTLSDKHPEIGVIDSDKIDSLKPFIQTIKDEFDGTVFAEPKGAPRYRSINFLYLYFNKSVIHKLRFVIQYKADNWLFINYYQFSIDGKLFDYRPNKIERDNGSGKIWEWSDNLIEEDNYQLIKALASAKQVKIRFVGGQYAEQRQLSSKELAAIKNVYEYFLANGGILTN